MQGPHHGQVVLPEPGKEHGEIEVIPVQVVQVHEVGLVRLQLADEPAGGVAAEKARAVGKPGQGQVQQRFRLAADDITGHVGGRVIARMADEGAVPGLHGRAAQGNRDAPRAQRGDDIDLGDAHAGAPFMRRGKMAAYSVSRSAGNGKGTKKRRPAKPGGRRRLTRGGAQGDHRSLHHSRFPAFRKYRRCARWPRAALVFARSQISAFCALTARSPCICSRLRVALPPLAATAHRADTSLRRTCGALCAALGSPQG